MDWEMPGSAPREPATGGMGMAREAQPRREEQLIYWESGQTVQQAAQQGG